MSIIVGIDPGLATCGMATCRVVDGRLNLLALEVFTSAKSDAKLNVRGASDLMRRVNELAEVMGHWTRYASVICTETMQWPRSAVAASMLGMAWGIIGTTARIGRSEPAPICEATPQQIKLAVCGNRQASKQDVQACVAALFPAYSEKCAHITPSKREHCADALGAIWACRDNPTLRLLMQQAATRNDALGG